MTFQGGFSAEPAEYKVLSLPSEFLLMIFINKQPTRVSYIIVSSLPYKFLSKMNDDPGTLG